MKNIWNKNSIWTVGAVLVVVAIGFWYDQQPQSAKVVTKITEQPKVEEKITVPIIIDTGEETINAAEIYLTFDPAALRVEAVSKENSFFQLWITDEPKFSNETGSISFAGGLPTPGFKGRGQVGSVIVTPLRSGRHQLTFEAKTRILRNDGEGTAVPLQFNPIIFSAK